MSATQEARVNRVRAKNLLLGAQFLGRQEPPPAGEKGSRPDLPPWWSNEVQSQTPAPDPGFLLLEAC